ncbi:MAG: UTP--glucose-1-phosphate uridylyltransferase, partial [Planctomycetota bacterium]
ALTEGGKILLRSKGKVFLSPDGHGGALRVLASGGGLEWFRSRGVDTLFYFQVDNPLLPVLDPAFLGHHLLSGSQFTTKVARKTGPEERMGVFARVDGRLRVVEYIHVPENLARARDEEGRLLLWAGNVAVHVIDLAFVEGLGRDFVLPLHAARKPEHGIDETGQPLDPATPRAIKLETFIFDAIPLAEKALIVEVDREEEFGPVKSSEGADTPENARRMMTAKAARWLESVGAKIPRRPGGDPVHPIEISPLTALGPSDLEALVKEGLALDGPLVL